VTTRWPWIILLTTFCCLFALTASASAECARVLWAQYDPDQWSLEAACSQTDGAQVACQRAIEDLIQRTAENPRAQQIAERIHLRHICLPDTVDPREVKR
jgi:hypothetical protein